MAEDLSALNKSIMGLEIRKLSLRQQLDKPRNQNNFAIRLELKEVERTIKSQTAQHKKLMKAKEELENNLIALRKNSCARFTVSKT